MSTQTPRRSPMMTVVAAVGLAMLLFLVNRAGQPLAPDVAPAPPAPVTYRGGTADGRLAVSVVVTGDRAQGHVAGRAGTRGVPLAAFLDGPVAGPAVTLGPRDGVRVDATVDGARMTGTVAAGGGPGRPFTAVADGGAR